MKCLVIFFLIALASAGSLTDLERENRYRDEKLFFPKYPEPKKKVFHEAAEHIQNPRIAKGPFHHLKAEISQQHDVAAHSSSRVAKHITPESSFTAINHLGVRDTLHHHLHHSAKHITPESSFIAINHLGLRDSLHHHLHHSATNVHKHDIAHYLKNTIEYAVEAQEAVEKLYHHQIAHGIDAPIVSGLHKDIFWARIKKLIDQHNEQEIKKEIQHLHFRDQQLQLQQQFINLHKQQIEAQLTLFKHHGASHHHIEHLEHVRHQLKIHELYLTQQKFEHHLALLPLQEALVRLEHQIQQDIVAEQIHERDS